MSKILKLAASIFLVVALCFAFTLDNVVSAASKNSKQDKQAMRIFRQSLVNTANDNKQILHQFFIFLVPEFQGELEFNAKIDGHSISMAGDLGIWLTNDKGQVVDTEIPFYIAQIGNNMDFFYKSDNEWLKYSAPTVAATVTDIVTSPTRAEIDKQVEMVKSVEILQDNDSRTTLLVRLDGAKLADELKVAVKENPADKGTANDAELQNKLFSYIDTGLRKADLWYTWKIDKKKNQTGAISFDLSPIIHETALAALNDPSNKDLPDVFRELLENLAYYSEFKAYTTFLGPEAATSLTVPQEVIDSAKPAKDLVSEGTVPTK